MTKIQPDDPPVHIRYGIETMYEGIRFRSRLEARWAAFFDNIGWRWEYEPIDAEGYIPDFALLGDRPVLVEVKPAPNIAALDRTLHKTNHRVRHAWQHDTLAVGISPLMPPGRVVSWDVEAHLVYPLFAVVGTIDPDIAASNDRLGLDIANRCHNVAAWHLCPHCGAPSFHTWGQAFSRLCGHSLDDDTRYRPICVDGIRAAWAEAANVVRWTAA